MKKYLQIIFLIFYSLLMITPVNLHAQWVTQVTGSTEAIRDIEFIDRYTGWVCGDNGTVYKTTNGGENWILKQTNVPGKILMGIHPVDANTLYCVGYFRTIIKSTNGGDNWTVIQNGTVGTGSTYLGVYFLNKDTGFISGTGGYIRKTTNGGITIDSISHLESSYKRDFYFKNSMEGLLVGNGSIVNKTIDGGQTWFDTFIIVGVFPNFERITCINDTCFVVGSNKKVYRSINFGNTWDSIGYVTGADEIYCSRFTNTLIGYAGGTFGEMFKTTDGGHTWKRENTNGLPGFFSSIEHYNDSVIWASMNGGRVLFTTTGGLTFVSTISNNVPDKFELKQNYPNPFNGQTNIIFNVKAKGSYRLSLYSIEGKHIDEKFNKEFVPGSYNVRLDMDNYSSGIYIYRLEGNGVSLSKKLMLVK